MTEDRQEEIEAVRAWLVSLVQEDFYGVVSLHLRGGRITHVALRQTLKPDDLRPPKGAQQ